MGLIVVGHVLFYLVVAVSTLRVWRSDWLYAALIIATLFCLRSATTFLNIEAGVDESQLLLQAKMFLSGLWPWISVDTQMTGPLTSLILATPAILGSEPTYESTHVLVLILRGAFCFFSAQTIDLLFPAANGRPLIGRLCALPILGLFCFSTLNLYDAAYDTTLFPNLFLILGFWFAIRYACKTGQLRDLFLSGLIFGTLPFVKQQSGPLAVLAWCLIVGLIASRKPNGPRRVKRDFLWFTGSAAIGPALHLGALLLAGGFTDFWISFVRTAAQNSARWVVINPVYSKYVDEHYVARNESFFRFLFKFPDSALFFKGLLLICGIGAAAFLLRRRRLHKMNVWPLIAAAALLTTAGFCAHATHLGATYYVTLLLFPSALMLASVVQLTSVPKVLIGSFILLAVVQDFQWSHDNLVVQDARTDYQSDLILSLQSLVRPGEKIDVWGWSPKTYLRTNTLPATRDAVIQFAIAGFPNQDYFLKRHLTDLKKSKPRIFIDATGSDALIFADRSSFGFENDPALKMYISENYELVKDLTLPGASPGDRIYRRR